MFTTEPKPYLELLQDFPPRPIKSERDYWAVQEVIDRLLDAGDLTSDQRDYLNLLGLLIHEYDEQHFAIPDLAGVELLTALIKELGLKQKDLVPIFKTESIVSAVLNGHRGLTVEHIEKLAQFFHVSPSVFFNADSQNLE
jgi:HTH-type transcriptional regulator/antitoxin HigA